MFGIEKAKFRNKTMKKIILLVPFEKWKWKSLSRVVSDSLWPPWNSPGQITGVGSLSLLQGIFATQGSNPGLPHCGCILYQLSHKGSPRILQWVAYPFSSGSSGNRNRTRGQPPENHAKWKWQSQKVTYVISLCFIPEMIKQYKWERD